MKKLSQREIASLVEKTQPIIPPGGGQLNIKSTLVFKIAVDDHGKVACLSIVSGHPLLIGSAIESMKGWEFRPYTKHGKRKPFSGKISLQIDAMDGIVKYEVIPN